MGSISLEVQPPFFRGWFMNHHFLSHLAVLDPEKKVWTQIFPTKYVIPKSLKFSYWPSKLLRKGLSWSKFGTTIFGYAGNDFQGFHPQITRRWKGPQQMWRGNNFWGVLKPEFLGCLEAWNTKYQVFHHGKIDENYFTNSLKMMPLEKVSLEYGYFRYSCYLVLSCGYTYTFFCGVKRKSILLWDATTEPTKFLVGASVNNPWHLGHHTGVMYWI